MEINMQKGPKIICFPGIPPKKQVGIYARVSSCHKSVDEQVSALKDYAIGMFDWELKGVYTDADSDISIMSLDGYKQLLRDCRSKRLNYVLVDGISVFDKDFLAVNVIHFTNTKIFFLEENLTIDRGQDMVMLALRMEDM